MSHPGWLSFFFLQTSTQFTLHPCQYAHNSRILSPAAHLSVSHNNHSPLSVSQAACSLPCVHLCIFQSCCQASCVVDGKWSLASQKVSQMWHCGRLHLELEVRLCWFDVAFVSLAHRCLHYMCIRRKRWWRLPVCSSESLRKGGMGLGV